MANLTKRDLVMRISKETGLVQQDVFDVIQKTLDYITDALAQGQDVELRNSRRLRSAPNQVPGGPQSPQAENR